MINAFKMYGALFVFTSLVQCCKPEKNVIIEDISEDMKAYFVNFKEGTRWIYLDTISKTITDTITLKKISTRESQTNTNTHFKEYILHYEATKTRPFVAVVSSGINNLCYVKFDPQITTSGTVDFENKNGAWGDDVNYFNTLQVGAEKFQEVVQSKTNNTLHYFLSISKNTGIVYFLYNDKNPQTRLSGAFKLIKKIEP